MLPPLPGTLPPLFQILASVTVPCWCARAVSRYEGVDVYSNCQRCVRGECSGASDPVARVLRVRALLPLVRESELVLARTKKGYYVCLKNKLLNQEQLNVKSRERKGTGKM